MAQPKRKPHFVLSLGKSMAQITAEFSPIPGFNLLVNLVCGIIELADNVSHNR